MSELALRDENLTNEPVVMSPLDVLGELEQVFKEGDVEGISVKTMTFEKGVVLDRYLKIFEQASALGIPCTFSVDGFYQLVSEGRPTILTGNEGHRKVEEKDAILAHLTNMGVNVLTTNPVTNPYKNLNFASGRSHIKSVVVSRSSGSVGYLVGSNITDDDYLEKFDCGVKVSDPVLVSGLNSNILHPKSSSQIIKGSSIDLLIDSGETSESLILQSGVSSISRAKSSILLTSQYYPDGPMVGALSEAISRGLTVHIIATDPAFYGDRFFSKAFNSYNSIAQYLHPKIKLPVEYYKGWMHAKVLLLDYKTPSEAVFVGTHNFSGKGVRWKNAEAVFYGDTHSGLPTSVANYLESLNIQLV